MTNLSHNPQSYVNGYISMMRNMILSSSVGLVVLNTKYRLISFFIFLFSISYGIKSSFDFNKYLNYLNTLDLEDPYKFSVKQWTFWIYFSYFYIIVLIFIILYLVIKFN